MQPEVEEEHARFEGRLAAWGAGFLKPRSGALGIQVAAAEPVAPVGVPAEEVSE